MGAQVLGTQPLAAGSCSMIGAIPLMSADSYEEQRRDENCVRGRNSVWYIAPYHDDLVDELEFSMRRPPEGCDFSDQAESLQRQRSPSTVRSRPGPSPLWRW